MAAGPCSCLPACLGAPSPGCADSPFPLLTSQIRTKWIPMVNGGLDKGSRYCVGCDLWVQNWGILGALGYPPTLTSF